MIREKHPPRTDRTPPKRGIKTWSRFEGQVELEQKQEMTSGLRAMLHTSLRTCFWSSASRPEFGRSASPSVLAIRFSSCLARLASCPVLTIRFGYCLYPPLLWRSLPDQFCDILHADPQLSLLILAATKDLFTVQLLEHRQPLFVTMLLPLPISLWCCHLNQIRYALRQCLLLPNSQHLNDPQVCVTPFPFPTPRSL